MFCQVRETSGTANIRDSSGTWFIQCRNPMTHLDHREYLSLETLLLSSTVFSGCGKLYHTPKLGDLRKKLSSALYHALPNTCPVEQNRFRGAEVRGKLATLERDRGQPGRQRCLLSVVLKAKCGGAGKVLRRIEETDAGAQPPPRCFPKIRDREWGCSHFTVPFRLYVYIKVARGENRPCPWGC